MLAHEIQTQGNNPQKKEDNIQNTAKVWNEEMLIFQNRDSAPKFFVHLHTQVWVLGR